AGGGQALLLLHGSGPGASGIGNWQPVLSSLAERFDVFAPDMIGFGKSGRKPAAPYFDYGLWLRQAISILECIPQQRVGVIAHSLSASIGLTMAADHPRVAGIMTTGAMGARFELQSKSPAWVCPR